MDGGCVIGSYAKCKIQDFDTFKISQSVFQESSLVKDKDSVVSTSIN